VIEGRDLQERSKPRELQEHEDEGHSLTGRWGNSHELRAGDWIITRSGTRALITEIRQHFEPAFPVSNLTIFGHHNYSVGDVGVLVHNVSVCDGTIADLRKLRADGMSEDKIKDWLRSKTDDNGNRLYNADDIEKALEEILAPNKLPPITPPTNRGGLRQAMEQPPTGMTNPNAHHDLPWTFRDWFARRGLNVNDPRFGRWVEGTPPGEHQRWSAAFDAEWRQFIDRFPNATADDVISFMNQLRSDPRFQ